jgi:hypothetical protein
MNINHKPILALILGLTVVTLLIAPNPDTVKASTTFIVPDWTVPIPITSVTDTYGVYGATEPVIGTASDGQTIMVVYNQGKLGGNPDPFYRRSVNNGETWEPAKPIKETSAKSLQVNIDYNASGIAHVVWAENGGLAYANEGFPDGGTWGPSYKDVVVGSVTTEVTNPIIQATGNNRLDIVWTEKNSSFEKSIYHAFSANNGQSWTRDNLRVDNNTSLFPAMVVDGQTNTIHVVWQEDRLLLDPGPPPDYVPTSIIMYAKGAISASSPTWEIVALTTENSVNDVREPEITFSNNTVHVVFTEFISKDEQYIQHTACSNQCNNKANWTSPERISGKIGASNTIPNGVSAITSRGQCSIVYLHGTVSNQANEIITGIDSCSGWGGSWLNIRRDDVTNNTIQSVNPDVSVQNNWWLYLAYDQGVSDGPHQIYLHKQIPGVYLPVTFK